MADRYEYVDGRCTVCGFSKPVRWKNLYLIGSEGIDICIECERDLLAHLRSRSTQFAQSRKTRIKLAKAIDKTFDEIMAMSEEEFERELVKYMDDPLTKMLTKGPLS